LFGVIDTRNEQAGREDDRSSNNRPGQWAAARLVYAGNYLKSVPVSLTLKREQVNRWDAEKFGLNHTLCPDPDKQDKCVNEIISARTRRK
jgi:hypothetical protein